MTLFEIIEQYEALRRERLAIARPDRARPRCGCPHPAGPHPGAADCRAEARPCRDPAGAPEHSSGG